jgi:membrane protein
MLRKLRTRIWSSLLLFIEKDAPSRGAAIAFYTATALAPILVLIVALAGFFFGQEAARGAVVAQLGGLLGRDTADLLQRVIISASNVSQGVFATLISIATLFVTASGAFLELQAALNALWDSKPSGEIVSRLLRARIASLGLILAMGFFMIVSLTVDTGITALAMRMSESVAVTAFLHTINFLFSFLVTVVLFAAIYHVLPAEKMNWRDTLKGAALTAVLFVAGKYLIGLYLGSGNANSALGAAGGLLVILFWVYYSAMIFLFGAALTRNAFARRKASDHLYETERKTISDAVHEKQKHDVE